MLNTYRGLVQKNALHSQMNSHAENKDFLCSVPPLLCERAQSPKQEDWVNRES